MFNNNCIILTNSNHNKYYYNPYSSRPNYYSYIRSSLITKGSRSAHDIFKQVINNRFLMLYIISHNLLLIEVVNIIPVLKKVLLATTEDELKTLPMIVILINITAGLEHVLLS